MIIIIIIIILNMLMYQQSADIYFQNSRIINLIKQFKSVSIYQSSLSFDRDSSMLNDVSCAADNKSRTLLVQLDLSIAFDTQYFISTTREYAWIVSARDANSSEHQMSSLNNAQSTDILHNTRKLAEVDKRGCSMTT